MPSLKVAARTGRSDDDDHFHMIEPDASTTGPAMASKGVPAQNPHTHAVKDDAEATAPGARNGHVHNMHDDGLGFGLRLDLDTERVKLLFGGTMPEVGSTHKIIAVGVIKSTRKSEESNDDEGMRMNVEVQLTHADFNPTKDKADRVLTFEKGEQGFDA